jgi:molecular chaperone IbpA
MKYDSYTGEVLSDLVTTAEQVVNNVWNLLEHPEFPFVTLTSTTNGVRNFPPYNIIEGSDGTARLEMAVAGYTKDRVKVEKQGNTLIVQGKPAEQCSKELIRHRGISNAAFLRTFDLNPNAEVSEVSLVDGILTVFVQTKTPPKPPSTTFEIK